MIVSGRFHIWGILLLVGLVSANPAFGQRNGFFFSEPLGISGGIDDVIQRDGSIAPAPLMFVDLGLTFLRRDPGHASFGVLYRPEIEVLLKDRQTARWNHFVDFGYDQPFGPRSGVAAGYSFVRTADPTRALADNVFALPRSEFVEHATAATVYRALTRRTVVSARFDNSNTDVSGLRQVSAIDASQFAVAGTVSVSRRMSERQRLSAAYSLLHFSPYSFENNTAALNFLPSVPTVRGGISRYAMMLAAQAANQSGAPTGLVGGTRVLDLTPTDASSFPALAAVTETEPGLPVVSDLEVFSHPFHAFTMTYDHAWRQDLIVDIAGGAMRDTETSYLLRMAVRKRINRMWLGGEFEHYPSHFAPVTLQAAGPAVLNGTPSWSTFSVLGLHLAGNITPRTAINIGSTYSRGTAEFLENATTLWILGGRVDYWLSERYGLFAEAESFSEIFAGTLSPALGRQRYFAGVLIQLGPRVR